VRRRAGGLVRPGHSMYRITPIDSVHGSDWIHDGFGAGRSSDAAPGGPGATFTAARARGVPVAARPGGVGSPRARKPRGAYRRTGVPARRRGRDRARGRAGGVSAGASGGGVQGIGPRTARVDRRHSRRGPHRGAPRVDPTGDLPPADRRRAVRRRDVRPGRRALRGRPRRDDPRVATPPAASSAPCATAPASANPSPCPHSAATSIGHPTTGPGLHRPRTFARARRDIAVAEAARPLVPRPGGESLRRPARASRPSIDRRGHDAPAGRRIHDEWSAPVPARPVPPRRCRLRYRRLRRQASLPHAAHITIIHVSFMNETNIDVSGSRDDGVRRA
jgi:hypothetical protein